MSYSEFVAPVQNAHMVAHKVHEARKELNLTIGEISQVSEVSESSIRRLYEGFHGMSLANADKLLNAFGWKLTVEAIPSDE